MALPTAPWGQHGAENRGHGAAPCYFDLGTSLGHVIARRNPKKTKTSVLAIQTGRQSAILDPILTKFELTGRGPILYQCTKYEPHW